MGQAGGKPEPIGILGFIGGQGHIWFVTNLAKRDLADIRSVAEAQKFGSNQTFAAFCINDRLF